MEKELLSRSIVGNKTIHVIATQKSPPDPTILDLFQKQICTPEERELWFKTTLDIALIINTPFWFSELRQRCLVEPYSPNWWGILTKKLKARGYRMTMKFRKSPIESRRGGMDAEWTK